MWRVSEYEKPNIDTLKYFKAKWIWLDSFNSYWFDEQSLRYYKDCGLSICLVSNELQGRNIMECSTKLQKLIDMELIDAVCTKDPSYYT